MIWQGAFLLSMAPGGRVNLTQVGANISKLPLAVEVWNVDRLIADVSCGAVV